MDFLHILHLILVEPELTDLRLRLQSTNHNLTSTQPGNYDHPPASSRNVSTQPQPRSDHSPDVSARLQHLRELLDNDRARDQDQRRRAMETLDRELNEMSAETMSARMDRRRRGLEAQIQNNPPMRVSSSSPDPDTIPINHTSSLMRSRRRPTRPSDRLQRHIDRLAQIERSTGRGLATSLHDDRSSPFPEPPQPPRFSMGSPDNTHRETSGEPLVSSDNHSRTKRRKLDTDDSRGKPFNYGIYGQVVEGALKMQLMTCDGGYYDSTKNDSLPEFVLTDDPTKVYSTRSHRVNILIRHFDNTPFSLTKLVIKAPQGGYDAGIQQGMVFVSMGDDELIDRTDVYKIKYPPQFHRPRRTEPPGIRPSPSQEYVNSVHSPLQSLSHSFVNGSPAPPRSQPGNQSRTAITSNSTNNMHQGPPLVPHFNVINEYDEKNDGDGIPSNHQTSFESTVHLHNIDNNAYISNSPQRSSDDSSSDGDGDGEWQNRRHVLDMTSLYSARAISRRPSRHYDNRRLMPNQIELGAEFGSTGAEIDGKTEEKLEPLLPHARFFIPREKYLASMKFDPPV